MDNQTPRRHADPAFLAAKLARVDEPHVAPLNAMVRRIREEHAGVPYFDPKSGGVSARILFLLEAPGPKAIDFISPDNNDQSAANMIRLLADAGIDRSESCFWNVVPFYIGNAERTRLRAAKQTDLDAGEPWVVELLGLLPRLETIVLMGRHAQKARKMLLRLRPEVRIVEAWHPSPRCLNSAKTRRDEILNTLLDAKPRSS
jgi:uracil-DNA glycosylase